MISFVRQYANAAGKLEDILKGTGRTTQQLDMLQDGDVFVTHSERAKVVFGQEIKRRGVSVEIIVASDFQELVFKTQANGKNYRRVIVDHYAQFHMIMEKLASFERDINELGTINPHFEEKEKS